MTIRELVRQAPQNGKLRIRRGAWANPRAYVEVEITNGRIGPWVMLFDDFVRPQIGVGPEPHPRLLVGDTNDDWLTLRGE